MRRVLGFMVMSLLVLIGCNKGGQNATSTGSADKVSERTVDVTDIPEFTAETINASAFWVYLNETSPFTDWSYMPGHEGMYEGLSPHGAYLEAYINNVGLSVLPLEKGSVLPYGSIIMKVNYDKDKQLAAYTAMIKVEGYNADANDWFWVKFSPEGEDLASGQVEGCIDCHFTKNKNDYVMMQDLSKIEL